MCNHPLHRFFQWFLPIVTERLLHWLHWRKDDCPSEAIDSNGRLPPMSRWVESSSVLFECGCFVRAAIHWEIKYAAPLHRETVLQKLSWHGQIARPSILLSLSVEFSQMPEPNRAACRFGTDMDIEVTPSLDSFCKKHCLFWNCLCQGKRFGKFWMTHVWCTE